MSYGLGRYSILSLNLFQLSYVRFLSYTRFPYSIYPIPIKIRRNSPAVTTVGGGTVKKSSAWSAGAVRKTSTASTTAKTAAAFGLRNNRISPVIGSNNPTIIKNAVNPKLRSSFMRVSNPNGVNRNPIIIPMINRTANIRSLLPKDFALKNEDMTDSPEKHF